MENKMREVINMDNVKRMSMRMKVTKCTGEGQGSCKRCLEKGKWNRSWMCFLYKIEGYEGCYCSDCVKEIEMERSNYGRK